MVSEIYYNGKNYINGFNRYLLKNLQSMISDCKNFVLSFNGEIYNTDHIKII